MLLHRLQETFWRNKPGSLVSVEDMLKTGFSLILKDDIEATLSFFQSKIPAERVSSLAANQDWGPCFIQGHFLLWFLDSGGADVCTPLSLEPFRFSDSVDAQHPQNNTVSSWQKGHKSGFSENPISLHLASSCSPTSNCTQLQDHFTPGLSSNQEHNFNSFFPPKK